MKKFFPILLLLMAGSAANAGGLSTRHQTSLQFINDGGHTEYTRMGASYSISGTNVTTSHTVGNNDPVNRWFRCSVLCSNWCCYTGTITAAQGGTNGSGSFSFSQSFTQADIAGTGSTYTDFGNVTVTLVDPLVQACTWYNNQCSCYNLNWYKLAWIKCYCTICFRDYCLLTMKRILTALLLLSTSGAAYAVPVVPNFARDQ